MSAPLATTIAALASAPGPGERGVLRLSGPRAGAIVGATCPGLALARRGAFRARFDDGVGTQPALVLWMPGPRSYTREDVAELHLPGNPFLLDAALARVLAAGATPAQPGEFTRRAFLNGRLDLTRAEGVLALARARDDEERRAASALLFGGLDERIGALRDGLESLRSSCEASLDFDESDTGHVPDAELAAGLARVRAALDEAASWETSRALATGAPCVVLAGAPNAGKSSLYNRLTDDGPRAIEALVDALAGSTLDVNEAQWELGGMRCALADTAGVDTLGPTPDEASPEGEARARALHMQRVADLVLLVVDAAGPLPPAEALPTDAPLLVVWNKVDLQSAAPEPPAELRAAAEAGAGWVAVSARDGTGLEALAAAAARALGLSRGAGVGSGLVRELSARHGRALRRARAALTTAGDELAAGAPLDLFAEALRMATWELDAITGRTTPEDLLTRIFAQFCLGK